MIPSPLEQNGYNYGVFPLKNNEDNEVQFLIFGGVTERKPMKRTYIFTSELHKFAKQSKLELLTFEEEPHNMPSYDTFAYNQCIQVPHLLLHDKFIRTSNKRYVDESHEVFGFIGRLALHIFDLTDRTWVLSTNILGHGKFRS